MTWESAIGDFIVSYGGEIIALIVASLVSYVIILVLQKWLAVVIDKFKTFLKSVKLWQIVGYLLLLIGIMSAYYAVSDFLASPTNLWGVAFMAVAEISLLTGLTLAFPAFIEKMRDIQAQSAKYQRKLELQRIKEEELARLEALDEFNKRKKTS